MKDFTIEQLGLFITLILSGTGALFLICFKSRCKTIKCCGCMVERFLTDDVKLKQIEQMEKDRKAQEALALVRSPRPPPDPL